MVIFIFSFGFGGEPIASRDGESLEGVGDEQRYYPYGGTRLTTGTIYTDKLFTGQRDTGLGIYDFHARFYSPKLGRFLSADSIVTGARNPQAYNRYSYTLNNPLRYIDPTGHWQDEGCGTGGPGGGTGCNLPPPPPCTGSQCNGGGSGGGGGGQGGGGGSDGDRKSVV